MPLGNKCSTSHWTKPSLCISHVLRQREENVISVLTGGRLPMKAAVCCPSSHSAETAFLCQKYYLWKWAKNYFYTLNYFNPLKNYVQSSTYWWWCCHCHLWGKPSWCNSVLPSYSGNILNDRKVILQSLWDLYYSSDSFKRTCVAPCRIPVRGKRSHPLSFSLRLWLGLVHWGSWLARIYKF